MKKTYIFVLILFSNSFINLVFAQEKPTDIMNSLPDFFPNICLATNDEVEVYAEYLGRFSDRIHESLEIIDSLKIIAKKTAKVNSNANIKVYQNEKVKIEKMLTLKDFDTKISKSLEPSDDLKKRMDYIGIQMGETSDWQKIEQLSLEINKIQKEKCQSVIHPFMEALIEHRAMLKANISLMIERDDLEQKIDCALFGYTYIPELSYENAYFYLSDHLQYMGFVIGLAPGEIE